MDLWVSDPDGSNARLVYEGPGMEAEPCWTDDSEAILFSTWDGRKFRIARITRSGAGMRMLTPDDADCRYPAFVKGKQQ